MTAERLKVRCYRCNQLLAVPAQRAGSVVACPKCKAELLIPSPESPAPGDGLPGAGASVLRSPAAKGAAPAAPPEGGPPFLEGMASVIPPEVADLRPEDLRVEAEFFENLTRPPVAPTSPELFIPPTAPEPATRSQELDPIADAGLFSVVPEHTVVSPATITAPPPIPPPR